MRPADVPALPRGRNVTVAQAVPPPRALRVQYPYEQAFDKSIVLACCIAAAMGLAVDARLVAAFLPWRYCHLAGRGRTGKPRPPCERGRELRLHHRAVFVPPFVPFAPLALYDIARRVRRERIWPALAIGAVFVCALVADLRGGVLTTRTLLLTAILSVAATLLSLRTASWSASSGACAAPATSCRNEPRARGAQPRSCRSPGLRSRARDARRTRPHRARDPR